jgi:hypothetical protein
MIGRNYEGGRGEQNKVEEVMEKVITIMRIGKS